VAESQSDYIGFAPGHPGSGSPDAIKLILQTLDGRLRDFDMTAKPSSNGESIAILSKGDEPRCRQDHRSHFGFITRWRTNSEVKIFPRPLTPSSGLPPHFPFLLTEKPAGGHNTTFIDCRSLGFHKESGVSLWIS
jgi:hypothetical protein